MNIKQLRKAIKGLPPHMEVVINQTNDEFSMSLAEEATVKNVGFSESPGDKPLCKEKCLVITDKI